MIVFLKGNFSQCTPTHVQVEVGGVGYGLNISLFTYEQLKQQTEGKVYTHLHVSDSAHVLYGFSTENEREMFRHLITISGIGPSIALAALSAYSPDELCQLIQEEQLARIQQIKGIGKKTAQRIVLELSDKLSITRMTAGSTSTVPKLQDEALHALLALGLSRAEAGRSIANIMQQTQGTAITLEELLKQALHVAK